MNIRKLKLLCETKQIIKTKDFDNQVKIPKFFYINATHYNSEIMKIIPILDLAKFIVMNKDVDSAYVILTSRKMRFWYESNNLLLILLEELLASNKFLLQDYIFLSQKNKFNFYSERLNKLRLFL